VVVSLPYDWLKSRFQLGSSFSRQVDSLMQKHLRVFEWSVCDELKTTAIQLLRLTEDANEDLTLESKALEFIALCLKHSSPVEPSTSNQNINSSARRIQEHLESNIIGNSAILKPNLTVLSAALGISTSSLQRNFKRQFKQTIFDYVRIRKLENARDYLKQENASIGEAAYRAGYKHGPNFSKAFKLAFGMSPGEFAKQS
jgi:AraC-like DNA-binding protein